MDPFRNCAAGVVSSAKLFRPEDLAELTTITASRYRARASRPSAALSVASQLLVDAAATPPLRGGEYSTFNIFQFIHTFINRPYNSRFATVGALYERPRSISHSLGCVRHTYIVTHQFAHFPGRDNPLFRFFTAYPALQVRGAVAAAQYFDNRTFQFDGFAGQ